MQIQSTVFSKRTIPNPFPTKRVLAEVVWEECEKCCLLLLLTPLLKALQVLSRTWVSTQTLPSERPFPFRNIPLAPFTWQILRVQKWVCHNPCSQLLFSTWALVSPRVLGQPVLELTNTPVKRKKKQIPRFEPKPTDSNFLACEVTQSCPTLCDPMDCSLPGSSVHGIFQARVLEWVAISFSRASSQPRDQTRISHTTGRCFTSNFLRGLIFISKRFW